MYNCHVSDICNLHCNITTFRHADIQTCRVRPDSSGSVQSTLLPVRVFSTAAAHKYIKLSDLRFDSCCCNEVLGADGRAGVVNINQLLLIVIIKLN